MYLLEYILCTPLLFVFAKVCTYYPTSVCPQVSHEQLAQLNTYVPVSFETGALSADLVSRYRVVVLTESESEEQQRNVASWCRQHKVFLVLANTAGLCAQVFCDFGNSFEVSATSCAAP